VLGDLVQTTDGRWMTRGPERCPNGHSLGPGQVLVGHVACLGHGGGGHTSWHCRTCDASARLRISRMPWVGLALPVVGPNPLTRCWGSLRVDPKRGKVTFASFYKEWSKRQVWESSTRHVMDQAVASVTFGNVELAQLLPSHFEEWVKDLQERDLQPTTIRTRFVNVRG
jgi:hypothetical protein